MREDLVNKITIENLIREAKKYKTERKSDLISYTEFLYYFQNIDEINTHNLIIGINFTYGWMPTIFDFRTDQITENIVKAVKIFNKAKKGGDLIGHEYDLLKSLLNNSLVGTTKLLHFINPEKFAIWDSRVYRYIHKEEPHDYRIGKIENYLDYQKLLKDLVKQKDFSCFFELVNAQLDYKPTNFRALELIMYANGKKETPIY